MAGERREEDIFTVALSDPVEFSWGVKGLLLKAAFWGELPTFIISM